MAIMSRSSMMVTVLIGRLNTEFMTRSSRNSDETR